MSTQSPADDIALTTTSYAILTQLALRPWSPYQLVQQRVRYFRFAWPAAESAIYREVKRLADAGLADVRTERTGKRMRTVYSITEAGLEELRAWLDTPVSPFALEFEGMIRLFAAPVGTDDQIARTLQQVQADARDMLEFGAQVRREFLDGRGALQEQIYVRALAVDFFISLLRMVDEWADRTLHEIEGWEGVSIEERNARGRQIFEALPLPDPAEAVDSTPVPPSSQDRRHR